MKIILDTNFLIYCAKNKRDYIEELENLLNEGFDLVVPNQVVEELESLKERTKKGSDKKACNLALQLLEHNEVERVDVNGESVDDGIIKLANKNKKNIVCTLDRGMRKILERVILVNRFGQLMLTR